MRKWLEGIALLSLGLLISITIRALFGPDSLPDRIPIHFDVSGHANGWGSPAMLLLLPAITFISYLLFTVVTRFPGAFNYPVRMTTANRRVLRELALDMMAWLKAEIVVLLTWMQWVTIYVARHPEARMPSMMPVALVVVFATIAWYMVVMFKAGKDRNGFL